MTVARKLAVAAGVILLLVALAVAAVFLFVDPDRIRLAALDRARAATGYAITTGDASLRLGWSGVGIRIDSLRVVSPDSLQTYTAHDAEAYVKLGPLFKKRVELARLVFHRPDIRIVPRTAPAPDAPTPAAPSPSATARPGDFGPSPSGLLLVESWSLVNGTYDQTTAAGRLRLSGLEAEGGLSWDARAGGTGDAGARYASGEWTGPGGSIPLPPAQASARFRISAVGDTVRLGDVEVTMGSARGAFEGTYVRTGDGWGGSLTGRVEPLEWSDLKPLLPEETLKPLAKLEIAGRIAVPEIRVATDAGSERSLVTATAEFSEIAVKAPEAPLGFSSGSAGVRISPGLVHLEGGSGRLGEEPVDFDLRIEGEESRTFRAAVRTSFGSSTLAGLLPETAPVALDRGRVEIDLTAAGAFPPERGTIPPLAGSVSLEGLGGALRMKDGAGGSRELPLSDLTGTLSPEGRGVRIQGLRASVGASDLRLDGTVSDLSDPRLEIRLESARIDLNELFPPSTKDGRTAQAPPPPPAPAGPKLIPIEGTASVGTIHVGKLTLKELKGSVTAGAGGIDVTGLSARGPGGGLVTGALRFVPAESGQWSYEGGMDLEDTAVGPILVTWTEIGSRVEGKARGRLDMKGRVAPGADPTSGLNLSGRLAVAEGAFLNLPGVQAAARAFRIDEGLGDRWPFRDLSVAFLVKEGRLLFETFTFSREPADWSIGGSAGLDGSLDLSGTLMTSPAAVTLPPEIEPLADYLAGPDGRMTVGFRIGGDVSSPSVAVDWAALGRAAAEKAKTQGEEKLQKKIDETVKDPETLKKLKKILGG